MTIVQIMMLLADWAEAAAPDGAQLQLHIPTEYSGQVKKDFAEIAGEEINEVAFADIGRATLTIVDTSLHSRLH